MRFEVKGGGIAAILFGMTLLSGAVFVLGLLAGFDVGRQAQIDSAQLATSYPLQSPSPSSAVPRQSTTGANNQPLQASNSASAPQPDNPPVAAQAGGRAKLAATALGPKHDPSAASATPARPRLASVSTPSSTQAARTPASSSEDDDTEAIDAESPKAGEDSSAATNRSTSATANAVASRARPERRKPYNIQIEAAMDISGADKMMARLQKLGYPAHLVPTEIAGQRWYKIEVGPYASAEEASDAEAELRQKYDETYSSVARGSYAGPSKAAPGNANDDSEE